MNALQTPAGSCLKGSLPLWNPVTAVWEINTNNMNRYMIIHLFQPLTAQEKPGEMLLRNDQSGDQTGQSSLAWERLGPDSFRHNGREFIKLMITMHLEKYVLIKIIFIFMPHSLLFVERSVNHGTTKQRIEKMINHRQV